MAIVNHSILKSLFAIFISLFLGAQSYGAGLPACQEIFELKSRTFEDQYVGVPGGIGHGRLHDQKCGEDCWAQALTSLVETTFAIKSDKKVKLSPEYNLFWHLYLQATENLNLFKTMRAQYEKLSEKPTKLQKLFDEAYGLNPTGKTNTLLSFQLDVGAEAGEALDKIKFSGVVPEIRYDQQITTDEKETRLEEGLAHFIGEFVLKGDNLDKYSRANNDPDKVNGALFNDLVTSLTQARAITQRPLRPDEAFEYNGVKSTPRNFLTEHMKFNPDDFRYIKTNRENQKQALSSIADSLRNHGLPVLVGLVLFGDDNIWMREQNKGLFTEQACGPKCRKVTGAHELLVVNYLYKDDPNVPTALIVQNSWGKIGHRDINGNKTDDPKKMGYYIVSVEYLGREETANPWDLVIPKIACDSMASCKSTAE